MDSTTLLIGSIVLLCVLTVLWARARARRIRKDAASRERRAMASVRGGGDPDASDSDTGKPRESTGETIFEAAPTGMMPGRSGIEVAEVLDIEELLRDEPQGVASRARAQLEEPTNIHMGDTLPPRPVASAPPAMPPAAPAPVPPAPQKAVAAAAPRAVAAEPARAVAAAPPRAVAAAPQNEPGPEPPKAPAPPVPRAAPVAAARQTPAAPQAHGRAPAPALIAPGGEAPLRELVLAWFEARGYRSSPASPVVRPIELVLRHKDDPARAYAFVVGTEKVTSDRVQQLSQQARGIGLIRLLIVADAGLTADAPNAKRGVRVLDRTALSAELAKLDISVAAKIIAVARKRAASRSQAG